MERSRTEEGRRLCLKDATQLGVRHAEGSDQMYADDVTVIIILLILILLAVTGHLHL